MSINNLEVKLAADVTGQASSVQHQRVQCRRLLLNISLEEERPKKEGRALDARAAPWKPKDQEHATHGQELQGLEGEVARLGAKVDKRRGGAQEVIARR